MQMQVQELKKYTDLEIEVEICCSNGGSGRGLSLSLKNFGRCWTSRTQSSTAARSLAGDALVWAKHYVREPNKFVAVVAAIATALAAYLARGPGEPT